MKIQPFEKKVWLSSPTMHDGEELKYVQQAYAQKRWAFVSDYVRLKALTELGGVYMDTDVEVIKSLDPYLKHEAFAGFENEYKLGDVIDVNLFEGVPFVDVIGISKGKGFQGVVKRHGFGGVGQSTHGQHNRARKPGSIGACSTPSRVFKGLRMGGRMGGDQVTVANLSVLKVIPENNLLLVKGSIPGAKGSYVIIEK